MATNNANQETTPPTAQAMLFNDEPVPVAGEAEDILLDEDFEGLDLEALLGYMEVPILLVDTDPERAVLRQKELMEACFGGIGAAIH